MKRNILLLTLGSTWAVVPEVYAFLAPETLPLYLHHPHRQDMLRIRDEHGLEPPDEMWVCTTQGAATQRGLDTLYQWHQKLSPAPILRTWQAEGTNELATQEECDHLQEMLLRACLLAHEHAGQGQVVLSLAGGRKTMSADLQWAGHLFGCHALLHVIACERVPEALMRPQIDTMLQPFDPAYAGSVMPLVAERCRRSELLDVDPDGRGAVTSNRFPLPLPESNSNCRWPSPPGEKLRREVRERERAGSVLLGNFLDSLAQSEHHENWRSLYRLPPRVIESLRTTALGPELRDWLVQLPKADLHRHLGGCLDLPAQREVGQAIWDSCSRSEQQAVLEQVRGLLNSDVWPADWPQQLKRIEPRSLCPAAALLVHASPEKLERNLYGLTRPRVALKTRHEWGFAAYERPGDLSGSALLAHPAAIAPYARCVVQQAVAEGLTYVELRGSPQKYGDGLAFLRAFRAAILDASKTINARRLPLFRFIIIGDRRQDDRLPDVVALAVEAKREMPDFIAGLDIAGDESVAPPQAIAHCFTPAFEVCLPVTIHAGEGEPPGSIWQAAYHLHADRIGHGLTIGDHPQLASRFRDRGICLELCPTSNREVVGFFDPEIPESHNYPRYPLEVLWRQGLPLTLATDNPGISRTSLADEYLVAARMASEGIRCWDALAMLKQAFTHAFLPSDEREKLLKDADVQVYHSVLQRFGA